MQDLKPFVGQLARLILIIAAILAGRFVVIQLPMVGALQRLPWLGVSANDLVTAIAYVGILVLLVGFARNVEAAVVSRPGGFPWQSLVAQGLILTGIVFAYSSLGSFAAALLGRHYWVYSVVLLLLALIPIVGIGKLLYEYMSDRIEKWES